MPTCPLIGPGLLTGMLLVTPSFAWTQAATGNVWSFATVIASEYSDKPLVQVVAYGAASLITVARFTAQRHYLSDILIGSAIGFGVGRYVYRVRHIDGLRRGSGGADTAKGGGTGKWPLVSPQVNRAARGYSIGLTWVY